MKSEKRLKAESWLLKFPNTSISSLADTLYKKNKLLYKDKEDARMMLRMSAGKAGKVKRNRAIVKQDNRPNGMVYNPYQLPAEEKNKFVPYIIPIKQGIKVAILSDAHIPYQDNQALTAALDYCKQYDPDYLILNGDWIDAHTISRHEIDPLARDFKYEVDTLKDILKTIVGKFKAKIIYKEGNHCQRAETFFWRKAPEIWGFEEFKLENLLGLKSLGIDWVGDKRVIKVGKLNVVHGHEFSRSFGSVNPARTFYTKAKTNVIGGHHHQISSYYSKDINGESHVAYSTGCLCTLTPQYMPVNEWSHGFSTVDILDNNGNFRVNNLKIIDGKIY